jgi:hypothetical protein
MGSFYVVKGDTALSDDGIIADETVTRLRAGISS